MKRNLFFALFFVNLLSSCGTNQPGENTDPATDSLIVAEAAGPVKIEFESLDSVLISANLYEVDPSKPVMVLCHQENYNKFEYSGTAERFNELGFNCLAIDLRCGGPIADQPNETWVHAKEAKKPVDYLNAEQDIEAAINFAYEKYKQPVILVGSSYSADLCIYQAIENEKVGSVIAFSPSNYWGPVRGDLTEMMIDFEKPFFFTAAYVMVPYVRGIVMGRQRTENQIVFDPTEPGINGAKALWATQEGGEEYWIALEEFLEKLKEPAGNMVQ